MEWGLDVLNQAMSEVSKIYEETTYTAENVPHTVPVNGSIKYSTNDDEVTSEFIYSLGKGLYIDKPEMAIGKTELRISLWRPKTLKKLNENKFSVHLDMDALKKLQMNMGNIWSALLMTSDESFLGYTLHLGHNIYVSVERGDCTVHFRQWYELDCRRYNEHCNPWDTCVELLPTRKGLKLDWDQFDKLETFVSRDVAGVVPGYEVHVLTCMKPEHVERTCPLCSHTGCAPMERQVKRIMADAARGVMTKKNVPPLTRRQVHELSIRMKCSWYRLIWIMNLSEELGETMIGLGTRSGIVYPAVITLLCWMLQNKNTPKIAHLMWLLDESGVQFEQEMYFEDIKFDLFTDIAYDWFVKIGGFYRE